MGNSDSGLVDGVSVFVDDGSLDDLLDFMNRVGNSNRDSTGDRDVVRLLDDLLDDDLSLDGNGNMDGNINGHLVDMELGLDVGTLGSDTGVRPHGSKDLLLGDGISGSRSKIDGCGRDGICGGGSSDGKGGGSDGTSLLGVDGLSSDIAVRSGLVDLLSGNVEFMSDLDGLASDLDGPVSDNTVLDVGPGNSRSSMVRLGNMSDSGSSGNNVSLSISDLSVRGSTSAISHKGGDHN